MYESGFLPVTKMVVKSAFFRVALTSLAIWVTMLVVLGSDYPYNYDSINYALAIVDDFDIGKCQPHAYGYIYHIFACRLWLPIIKNPFRIQQLQSVIYLFTALFFMIPTDRKKSWLLLVPATVPLSLFFAATSVIHAVSFTASAAIAWAILRLEEKKIHPVVVSSILAVAAGFRQDLVLFMGPVVLFSLLRRKISFKEWCMVLGSGSALTAVWYIATSWSSGWLSPYHEANAIVKPFLESASLLYGAPHRESLRVIMRMFLYAPAVLGPGGALFILLSVKQWRTLDWFYLLSATLPFFLYGILFYLGIPNYYATITGFVFAWILLRDKALFSQRVIFLMAVSNLLFFWVVPAPLTVGYGSFDSRPRSESVIKQLSYGGVVGRASVLKNRSFDRCMDESVRKCSSFSAEGMIEYDGVPYWRAWNIMAESVWNNRYMLASDSAECVIRKLHDGARPDVVCDSIGVWHTTNRKEIER